ITCFASPSTQNFTTKATKSLVTTNHELQCLYEPYEAWNQNLSFFWINLKRENERDVICVHK
ncbi:unnamed protein product, partial [Brassica rapa]